MVVWSGKITGRAVARDIVIFSAAYAAGLMFIPNRFFFEMLNGMLAAICMAVCAAYLPSVIELFRHGATANLIIRTGIVGAWSFQMAQAVARVYFLEFRPEVGGRTFDALLGAPAVGYIVFASLHIIAIGMIENKPPRRNICIILWALMAGSGITGALALAHLMVR